MTRYRVRVSAELLGPGRRPLNYVQGWRLVAGPRLTLDAGIVEFEAEDDSAPAELEGELVTPTFRYHGDGSVSVISRQLG